MNYSDSGVLCCEGLNWFLLNPYLIYPFQDLTPYNKWIVYGKLVHVFVFKISSITLINSPFISVLKTSSITLINSPTLDLPPAGHRHWEQLFWHDILHPGPPWETLRQQPLGADAGGLLGVCAPHCAWSRHTVLPVRHTGGSFLHHGGPKARG